MEAHNCWEALNLGEGETLDEVYQLAADMGGMGFIHTAECNIMHNSALININRIDAAAKIGVGRYFFSSSVCVYRDMEPGEPALDESDAYPALPDNEYGWEKLYAERMALAYARHYPIKMELDEPMPGLRGKLKSCERQSQSSPRAEGDDANEVTNHACHLQGWGFGLH